jgi:hypothetical protein
MAKFRRVAKVGTSGGKAVVKNSRGKIVSRHSSKAAAIKAAKSRQRQHAKKS